MRRLMPRQMKGKNTSNQFYKEDGTLQSLVTKLQTAITTAVFGSTLVNIAFSTSLQTLWGMINALQIVILLPLANLYFPPSTQLIFDMLTHIFNFEFYDLTPYLCMMLRLDPNNLEEQIAGPLQPQFSNFGYDSLNAILNLNNAFATFIVIIFLDLVVVTLSYFLPQAQNRFKLINLLDKTVRHNMLARFTLQCFIQLILCSLLNFYEIKSTTFANSISGIFSTALISYLVIFMVHTYKFVKNYESDKERLNQGLWISLIEGLNPKNMSKIHFNTYYMGRRAYLAVILVCFQDSPIAQMWLFFIQNFLTLVYIIKYPPFDSQISNKLELFNEGCITLATYHLIIFTDAYVPETFNEDEGMSSTELMGWSLTLLVLGQLAVNTLVMLALSVIANFRKARAFIKRRMNKDRVIKIQSNQKQVILPQSNEKIKNMNRIVKLGQKQAVKQKIQQEKEGIEKKKAQLVGILQQFQTTSSTVAMKVELNQSDIIV
ncbi:hypothetical protein FGO68_gene11849 [Halteria grandinella]|uniref:Transmembrane protein n=1 Tax=Halteria grandinella TaxID=5974 RepID=A0A8J8P4K1_HALGN|nr:hypothetical protein FGO68_gene11849 [Halteria grandinella]